MNFLKSTIFLFLLLLVSCSKSLSAPPKPIMCNVPLMQEIPSKPLEGIVYGRRVRDVTRAYLTLSSFEIIQPLYSDRGVMLPTKAQITIDTIIYPLASDNAQTNAKLYEGKTFSYGLGKDILPERIGFDNLALNFTKQDGRGENSYLVNRGHKFLVQFGKLNKGKMPVKLYLCASSLATQISGDFEVEFGDEPYWE
jgi:hypothetical protein